MTPRRLTGLFLALAAGFVALLAAVLVFAPETARAQTTSTEIFSKTLTVGTFGGEHAGYWTGFYGSLDSASFSYQGRSYTITRLNHSGNAPIDLHFLVGSNGLPSGSYTLQVSNAEWTFQGTDYNAGGLFALTLGDFRFPAEGEMITIRLCAGTCPASTPFGQVTGLNVTPAFNSLELGWIAVTDATGYKVQWKSGTESFDSSREAAVTTNSYTIPNLTAGTAYTVRVAATKSGQADAAWSNEMTGTPTATPPTPENLTAVWAGGKVVLEWDAVKDADSYVVQWKATGEDYDATNRQAAPTGASHAITGLTPGTSYTVRVAAIDSGVTSAWSAELTTPAAAVTISGGREVNEGERTIFTHRGSVLGYDLTFSPAITEPVTLYYAYVIAGTTATYGNNDFGYYVRHQVVPSGPLFDALRSDELGPIAKFEIDASESSPVSAANLPVTVFGDDKDEPDETVRLRLLGAANAALGDTIEATNTIINDDGPPEILVDEPRPVYEGNSIQLELRLTTASETAITVNYAVVGGTATAGERGVGDYPVHVSSGTITFPPSTAVQTLNIWAKNDDEVEGDETIILRFSNAVGAPLRDADASGNLEVTATILDEDSTGPMVTIIGGPPVAVGEAAEFTIIAQPVPTTPVAVRLEIDGTDGYVTSFNKDSIRTVNLPLNQATFTYSVPTLDCEGSITPDADCETTATSGVVRATLLRDNPPSPGAPRYARGEQNEATVTVGDNDSPGVIVSAASLTVAEDGGTASYTVKLNTPPLAGDNSVTVTRAFSGDAVTVWPASVTFNADNWNTPQMFTVTGANDHMTNLPGGRFATVTHTVASANNRYYNGIAVNPVFVVVTDDDEANTAPTFSEGGSTTRTFEENTATNTNIGAAVTATDAENDTLTYSLSGADATSFEIDGTTGQLKTKSGVTYDHEAKASYSVTVSVHDGKAADSTDDTSIDDTIAVTLSLEDVAEPPLAPGQPTVTAVTGTTNTLSVVSSTPDNAGRPPITGYRVQYRVADSDDAFTLVDNVYPTRNLSIDGLQAGTEYEVQVRAVNDEGDGAWSDSGTGSTNAAPPGQVIGLTATAADNALVLAWTAVSDADGYRVQWKSGTEAYDSSREAAATTNSHTIPNLVAGTEYTVRVAATNTNAADDGPWSDDATGTPTAPTEPTLSIDSPSASESAASMTFTVSLSRHPGGAVRVFYRLAGTAGDAAGGGTAESNEYNTAHVSGFVTFRNGSTEETVTVSLTDDSFDEYDETIRIELYRNGNHPIGAVISSTAGVGVGTIMDDDPEPEFFLVATAESPTEGGGGTKLTVRRDAISHKEMSVQFTTVDGTVEGRALGGTACGTPVQPSGKLPDYVTTSGTLTFPAKTASSIGRDIPFETCAIAGNDVSRAFTVDLSNPMNGTVSATAGTATVTIQDNDDAPMILVVAPDVSESAGSLAFNATLSAVSNLEVTVDYADAGTGTAASGTDYTAVTAGTLTFAPGETEKTVSVALIDDNLQEDTETVVLAFSNPVNASLDSGLVNGRVTGQITDEGDMPPNYDGGLNDVSLVAGGAVHRVDDLSLNFFGATSYSAASDATGVATAAVSGATLTVTPVGPGMAAITVTATNAVGSAERTFEATVSPAQVTGLTAAPATTALVLAWPAVPGAEGYTVQWKSGTESYSSTREASVATNEHAITGLTPGTAYTVRVAATATDLPDGPWSADETATLVAAGVAVATTPATSPLALALTEGGADGSYTVVLASRPAPGGEVTVTLSIASSAPMSLSAADRAVYDSSSATLNTNRLRFTDANWSTPQTVMVTPGQDTIVNAGDRRVAVVEHAVTNTGAPGYNGVAAASVKIGVADDDGIQGVSVSGPGSVDEGGTATFTVTSRPAPSTDVTVNLSRVVKDNCQTAACGTGEGTTTTTTHTVVIQSGRSTAEHTFATANDGVDEYDGSIAVTVEDGTGYTKAASPHDTAKVAVVDDESAPVVGFSETDYRATESLGKAIVRISIAPPTYKSDVTVEWATLDEAIAETVKATPTDDYPVASGTVTFDRHQPGTDIVLSTTIEVAFVNDTVDEFDEETFSVQLSNPQGAEATLGHAKAGIRIFDNDAHGLTASAAAVTVAENGGTATYMLHLANEPGGTATVTPASSDTGIATVSPATLTFDATNYATPQAVTITGVDDTVENAGGQRMATISHKVVRSFAPTAELAGPEVAVTATDNELPVLTVVPPRVAEGGPGDRNPLTFTATLSRTAAEAVTVEYRLLLAGTASIGVDIESLANGTLSIAAGQRSGSVAVTILGDSEVESDEMLHLRFENLSQNAQFASGVSRIDVTGTIANDDLPPPTLTVSPPSAIEGDPGERTDLVFTARLSRAIDTAVQIDYRRTGGTATSGTDFEAVSPGTLTIRAGSRSASVTVTVLGDDVEEDSETVILQFHNLRGGAMFRSGTTLSVTGTISSNSPPEIPYFGFVNRSPNSPEFLEWVTDITAGERFAVRYGLRDRDDPRWDRDEDGIHDIDEKPVLEDAGISRWSRRNTGELKAVPTKSWLSYYLAPNVAQDTYLQYTVTVVDKAGARTERTERLLVKPRGATAIARAYSATGGYVYEGEEARLNGGHSYGGFRVPIGGRGSGHWVTRLLDIRSYQWSQVSGPAVTWPDGKSGARVTFTAPTVHKDTPLLFQLDVTDEHGNRASTHVTYAIKDSNQKPVSLPGFLRNFDTGCPTFRLYSYGSDPDKDDRDPTLNWDTIDPDGDGIVSYQWRIITASGRVLATHTTGAPRVESYRVPRVDETTHIISRLTVTDFKGAQGLNNLTASYRLGPEDFEGCDAAPGTPPTGNAGPDREASPGQRVTLDGRGSANPHGASHQLTYGWEQLAGTRVALDDPSRGDPSFTAPAQAAGERLVFQLMVTDRDGETDSDTTTVAVAATAPPPEPEESTPPTADAGPDLEATPGQTVTLRGGDSVNPHGQTADLAYLWRQISGPTVTLSGETLIEPSFTMPSITEGAALEFLLTVTDPEGESDSDTVTVTARAEPSVLPTARAGPDLTGAPGENVTLQGKGSTNPYGKWYQMAHSWTQLSGPTVDLSDVTVADPSFTLPDDAEDGTTLAFQLTVTDREGQSDSDTMTVTVRGELVRPTANAGPDLIGVPSESVTLQGKGSTNPYGKWWHMDHRWTQLSGPTVTLSDVTVADPTFTVPSDAEAGTTLEFRLTVTDEKGRSDSDTMTVTVMVILEPGNTPPTASIDAAQVTAATAGETVQLQGAGNDAETAAESLTFTWSQAAGTPSVSIAGANTATASFTAPEVTEQTELTFRLTVTDEEGLSADAETTITVSPPPERENAPPTFDEGAAATRSLAENSAAGTNVGGPIAATDPDDDSLTYSLSGVDAGSFDLNAATGQIATREGVTYDYEAKATYAVTVAASDPEGGSASIAVTVSLTDVEEAEPNRAPVFDEGDSATRTLAENAAGGEDVGLPLVATDQDDDNLTYALSGADAGSFNLDHATGQLTAIDGGAYDYETRASYSLEVIADDGKGLSASILVTVNLTNVNEAPAFDEGSSTTRQVAENSAAGVNVGAAVVAIDPDGDTLAYTLSGSDAGSFGINDGTGQLQTIAGVSYDYETQPSYSLVVTADDPNGGTASILVTVNLIDVDEAPPDTAPTVSDTSQFKNHDAIVGEAFSVVLPAADAGSGNGVHEYILWKRGAGVHFGENGLTFDAATREVSGTPSEAGTFRLAYQVHDADDNRSRADSFVAETNLQITVAPPPDTAPTVSDTSQFKNHAATVGEAFSVVLPAADEGSGNGGPYEYLLWHQGQGRNFMDQSINGLRFDAATRTLSGTPEAAGVWQMSYVIHDADENRSVEDRFRERDRLRVTVSE